MEVIDIEEKKMYEIEDVQDMLGICRTNAYDLVKKAYRNQGPFRVIKIGRLYRIPKNLLTIG